MNPDDSGLVNQEEIMQRLQAAVRAYQCKDLDSAETIFKQILAANPKESNALHLLGCIYKDRGQLQQAVDLIQASIQEDGSNPIPFVNLGKILAIAGQYESAVGFFQESLKRNPQISEAWFCLGNALRPLEKREEAMQAYRNTLELDPDHAAAANNLGALLDDGDESNEADAVSIFVKAIEANPLYVNLRINYGKFLAGKGDHAAALDQYRYALPLAPDSVELHYNFANSLKEEGEVEESIVSYRKAIELKPDFAEAYFALGLALKEKGEAEGAIASYHKAIELKPDFVDAYISLGTLLKDLGSFDEARQIVAILRQMNSLEKKGVIHIQDKALVFDWHSRTILNLSWNIEIEALLLDLDSPSRLAATKQIDALFFPPLFLADGISLEEEKMLYVNGYLVEEDLIPSNLCAQLVDQFNGREPMSAALIKSVAVNGILETVLERILLHTGFPHLIWNCIYFSKGPDDQVLSDAWHYDNHYNVWTPKLMIYLNSQEEECGATEFVNTALSLQVSRKSDYMGLLFQRESYSNMVNKLVEDLGLDPVTSDPEHYTFSPDHAGSGVWFCPSRALHRGVNPKTGCRHVLSFSLTPLPVVCGWSVDQCVEKSIEILQDKIDKGMQASDINPYWISSGLGCI